MQKLHPDFGLLKIFVTKVNYLNLKLAKYEFGLDLIIEPEYRFGLKLS